jgi:Putative auto-transporter adhesin, head GIN domain
MRASQRVLLAALGVVLLLVLIVSAWLRHGLAQGPALTGERAALSPALEGFAAIDVLGGWQLTITRADTWRVALDVPAALQDYFDARVVDGRLQLGLKDGLRWGGSDRARMSAEITMPEFRGAVLNGAARLDFRGFEGDRLEIAVSGAGKIEGHASRFGALALTMSGAGAADLGDVTITDADVAASGANSIKLRMAGGRLTGRLSGAGHLEYSGTVSVQNVAASGLVNVEHVE